MRQHFQLVQTNLPWASDLYVLQICLSEISPKINPVRAVDFVIYCLRTLPPNAHVTTGLNFVLKFKRPTIRVRQKPYSQLVCGHRSLSNPALQAEKQAIARGYSFCG